MIAITTCFGRNNYYSIWDDCCHRVAQHDRGGISILIGQYV